MSTHIDALRDIATNHGWPVCDEAADEIEELETAYALLFKENGRLAEACLAAIAGKAELLEALQECQSALAVLTEPRQIPATTVYQAWGIAVAAEQKARAAIAKHSKEQA